MKPWSWIGLLTALGGWTIGLAADSQSPGSTKLALPAQGAYTGAYIDFGETEDKVTLETIRGFERLVGKSQAIIAFSSYWGRRDFPREAIKIIDAYGAVPLVYWSPWDRPYSDKSSGPFGLDRILAGENDAYIDTWVKGAKAFGKPLLVAWGIEMNGTWFPWSGYFYGAGTQIPGAPSGQFQGPELYKKAYRYVVDRARAQGADNIQWVFHANNSCNPDEPWNQIARYYPGPGYVDWIGLSAYGQQYPQQGWLGYDQTFPQGYREIVALAPDKPFILAEWGVGEFPKDGSKGAWLTEAFNRFETEMPQLKAAVFWHERWQNADLRYSNLRVHSSEESLQAYRAGVQRPFWLGRPQYRP